MTAGAGAWGSNGTVANFSAACWWTGARLHDATGLP
eukprot:gene9556-8775_t